MLSDSEQFILDYPTISASEAFEVLRNHSIFDADYGDRGDIGCSFDPEGYEHIMYLNDEGEINTEELLAWLGY